MTKRTLPVNQWLLKNASNLVTRLERENNLMVRVGNSESLGLQNVKLFVPEGIIVYQIITNFKKEGQEYFFSVKEGADLNLAYLSAIRAYSGELNYAKNVGELLKYPCYDNGDSSFAFERLSIIRPIDSLILPDPQSNHPLS